MNDRREQFVEQTKAAADNRILESKMKMEIYFRRNQEEINTVVQKQTEHLFLQLPDKEWAYWEICYLHSSLFMKTHEYRMSLYDTLHLIDPAPVSVRIGFPFIYQYFEEDIEHLTQIVKKKMQRIYSHEVTAIREYYNKYYIGIVNKYIKDTLPELMELETFQNMKKTDEFRVSFGEYMGRQEVLWK